MPKKGQKSTRGLPEFYEELKKRVSLSLTPTAISGLDELATAAGLSRSEFVERIGRKAFTVVELTDSDLGESLEPSLKKSG